MSDKHESMIGIMKLYELRREETMREGRNWYGDLWSVRPNHIVFKQISFIH